MQIMCDREYAFDNLTSVDSDQYKICFNLEKKEQMLKEIQDSKKDNSSIIFDTSLLSDPRLVDLPLKDFLNLATSSRIRFYWTELNIEWKEIYKEFFRCQNGGDMQDSQYIHKYLLPVGVSKQQMKDTRALILSQTNTFISMYKSLKIGWQEIEHIYPRYSTYNDLFLGVLSAHYSVKIFRLYSFEKSKQTERSISSKLDIISELPKLIMSTLEHSCKTTSKILMGKDFKMPLIFY